LEEPVAETNRQILLKRRPNGMPVPEDFAIVESAVPEPGEGQVLLRGIYLSLDPYMRGRISGQQSYAQPTEIGAVIEGRVAGQVARSRHPGFREAAPCKSSIPPPRRSRQRSAFSACRG
jgi:NADPH-dependent curcumin reductase CurA